MHQSPPTSCSEPRLAAGLPQKALYWESLDCGPDEDFPLALLNVSVVALGSSSQPNLLPSKGQMRQSLSWLRDLTLSQVLTVVPLTRAQFWKV